MVRRTPANNGLCRRCSTDSRVKWEIRKPVSEIETWLPDPSGLPLDPHRHLQESALPRHRAVGSADLALQEIRSLIQFINGGCVESLTWLRVTVKSLAV